MRVLLTSAGLETEEIKEYFVKMIGKDMSKLQQLIEQLQTLVEQDEKKEAEIEKNEPETNKNQITTNTAVTE